MNNYFIPLLIFGLLCKTPLNAQTPQPTEKEALLVVSVKSMAGKARQGEIVQLIGQKTKKSFSGITDVEGKFSLLIPEGDTYQIEYKTLGGDKKYDQMPIPDKTGIYSYQLNIKYDPPKSYTLEDVFFDTGKSSLRPESYRSLNNLVELLKAKPSMEIEIAGHTDNVGTPESNLTLSLNRAKAVKNYLVSKGINEKRITTQGYGDTQPVASNDNEGSRQQNRRTVVKITKE